jgi:hypothetical protein
MALFADNDKLRCPKGHYLRRDVWMPSMAAIRCSHRGGSNQPECGSIMLLIALTDGLKCVVSVSHVEAMHIEQTRMSPVQAAHYLGLTWAEPRIAGGAR